LKKEKKAIAQILHNRSDILFGYLFGSKAKGYANLFLYFSANSAGASAFDGFLASS